MGPLGEIAEILLFTPRLVFTPRLEGFIIFHGNLKIPDIDVKMSPQHDLLMIKNPNHSSLWIRSAAALHYPTRKPALGTLVTLSLRGRDQHEATVVAIEQNHWPEEWTYMVRIEEIGKPPELLMTILDRGSLNSQDISTRIRPKAIMLTGGDKALYFNGFERPIQVTIIQKVSPGSYETVRIITPSQAKLSPRMKVQDIESHRLLTVDMSPPRHGKAQRRGTAGADTQINNQVGTKKPMEHHFQH